jgi:hypothetical protein
MKKLLLAVILLSSCSKEEAIEPKNKIKTGCECNDGTVIVWNENLLKQTSWLTGNPCYDKGGIKNYIYK